ncbi:hypothetical protein AWV80_17020 [Cupriavidus sp. UYMU48A]|nr:hypothetical protein AWV80_17020 [Cupriavidus sp. UYMU48A]
MEVATAWSNPVGQIFGSRWSRAYGRRRNPHADAWCTVTAALVTAGSLTVEATSHCVDSHSELPAPLVDPVRMPVFWLPLPTKHETSLASFGSSCVFLIGSADVHAGAATWAV